MRKRIIQFILFVLVYVQIPVFAQDTSSFSLAGIIENIINYQEKYDFVSDIVKDAKDYYNDAEKDFNNGNVVVAYSEYLNTINTLDKNIALLMLSKRLYERGFFSLGDLALSKISGKNKMQVQINELKNAYRPFFNLSNDEEGYLAKTYALIYFNSSPEEAAFNLIKKTSLLENSDYANFIMANSMFECRQYNQALIYVNKAIEKNDINSNYKYFKAKIIFAQKKYKEALKYIETLEEENKISFLFERDFKILKEQILSNLSEKDADKKFHQIYAYYLAGNYYKVLKETNMILNFSKSNHKILTLQAMAHIALGEISYANEDIKASLAENKNFEYTKMAQADCYFIEKEYKKAYETYKKLFNTNLKKEALLKAYISYEKLNPPEKKLSKMYKLISPMEGSSSEEYYLIANNLFNEGDEKKKYTAKSLGANILNKNAWEILIKCDYLEKNFENMDKALFFLTFFGDNNAEYYYYSALSLNNLNRKREAFYELKKALSLNPDYKPAADMMNVLQNELI